MSKSTTERRVPKPAPASKSEPASKPKREPAKPEDAALALASARSKVRKAIARVCELPRDTAGLSEALAALGRAQDALAAVTVAG